MGWEQPGCIGSGCCEARSLLWKGSWGRGWGGEEGGVAAIEQQSAAAVFQLHSTSVSGSDLGTSPRIAAFPPAGRKGEAAVPVVEQPRAAVTHESEAIGSSMSHALPASVAPGGSRVENKAFAAHMLEKDPCNAPATIPASMVMSHLPLTATGQLHPLTRWKLLSIRQPYSHRKCDFRFCGL